MSILINNNLIWVSIPRNASHSIEKAIVTSDVKIKHWNRLYTTESILNRNWMHQHVNKDQLQIAFGNKETFCIKRDFSSRWISSLEHFWDVCIKHHRLTPIINYEDIDNDFIYNTFNTTFGNILYNDNTGLIKCTSMLVKQSMEDVLNNNTRYETQRLSHIFASQNKYLDGEKCTYEFDIKELDKFKTFYENRYDVKIDIPHENASPKKINKIILDDDLKNHLWEVFEKPFAKDKKYHLL
jgi:hypothetical protein